MGIDIAPIGASSVDATARRAPRAAQANAVDGGRDAATLSSVEIPASPPPELLEAMDAAGRVARELHATGRELRFTPSEDGGRVRVDVCDLDGNVLRTIPASELLDVAAGAPLE